MNAAARLAAACLLFTFAVAHHGRAADHRRRSRWEPSPSNARPAWKWVEVAANSMRKAQLLVDGDKGQSAEVLFFTFGPGQGGGVQENSARWVGQFDMPDGSPVKSVEETAEVKGTKITRVRVDSGIFNSGMPGGPTTPQADYGFYGAILESKDGDVFIKLTGPGGAGSLRGGGF